MLINAWRLLATALACALIVVSPAALSADVPPSADIADRKLEDVDFPRMREIHSGVFVYEGLHSPLPDGTLINTVSLIVVTSDGVMVVDGQGDIWQTKLLIENVRKLTSQPIVHVVVASDHGDHVGGNAAFTAAYPDVQFFSTAVSRGRLPNSASYSVRNVSDAQVLTLGETEIQILNLGRAHTGGDLAVYLPESKVLFLGEIYLRGLFPAMNTAHPTEWVETVQKAQAMDVSWYVPGHGFIDDEAAMKRDLDAFQDALVAVIDESKRLRAAGLTCESPTNCPAVNRADWGRHATLTASDMQAPFAIRRVFMELQGGLDGKAETGGGH